MRCALNLAGVSTAELARGDLLAHPGALAPAHLIDARFRYLSSSRAPLGRRSRVLLHHGTAQLLATLVLVDTDKLEPGGEGLVQLRLDIGTPLAALPGDRFIVRGFAAQKHYGTTLGGGEVVRVQAPKVRRSSEDAAAAIAAMAEAAGDERVALEIKAARVAGLSLGQLIKRLGAPRRALAAATGRLTAQGDLAGAGPADDPVFLHAETFAVLEKDLIGAIDAAHREAPERGGVPRQELRGKLPSALPVPLFDAILEGLVVRERAALEGDRVRPAAAARLGSEPMSPGDVRVLAAYRGWGVTPPRLKDQPGELGMSKDAVSAAHARLAAAGHLVKIKPDLYLESGALAELRVALESHLEARGEITPAEWKQITGASRKWSIPLAEYFDQIKLTLRVGDVRKRRG
jgi:selenocysteine-specific elongation factor